MRFPLFCSVLTVQGRSQVINSFGVNSWYFSAPTSNHPTFQWISVNHPWKLSSFKLRYCFCTASIILLSDRKKCFLNLARCIVPHYINKMIYGVRKGKKEGSTVWSLSNYLFFILRFMLFCFSWACVCTEGESQLSGDRCSISLAPCPED